MGRLRPGPALYAVRGAGGGSPTQFGDNGQKGRGQRHRGRLGFAFLTGRPGCCTLFRPRHPIPRQQNRAAPQPLPGSVCVTTKRSRDLQITTPHAVRAHRFGPVCRIPGRPYVVHFPERKRTKSQFLRRRSHKGGRNRIINLISTPLPPLSCRPSSLRKKNHSSQGMYLPIS